MTHLLARELLHGLAALREPLEQPQAVEQRARLVRVRLGLGLGSGLGSGLGLGLGLIPRQLSSAAACGAAPRASAVSASAARSMACSSSKL